MENVIFKTTENEIDNILSEVYKAVNEIFAYYGADDAKMKICIPKYFQDLLSRYYSNILISERPKGEMHLLDRKSVV
jgi:hypothetical protein